MDRQFGNEALDLDFMENTHQVLFEDDSPKWYVALGDKWVGPLSASDVYARVEKQELTMAHFVWTPGQANWQRVCDTKAFQVVVPGLPGKNVKAQVEEASKPVVRPAAKRGQKVAELPPIAPEEREWFLYYNDSQFGPFTKSEIQNFLDSGRIHSQVHAWKDGLAGWELISKIAELAPTGAAQAAPAKAKTPPSAPNKAKENRSAPRTAMVAKIMIAAEDSVLVGICRDVSVGGMQVLAEHVPGQVGTKLKINVSPTSKTDRAFSAFTAQGTIVRVLEDGRGFSFRFEQLSASAKRAIESYIEASQPA